jgi:hypothetical protein
MQIIAAAACATVLWLSFTFAVIYDTPRSRTGNAWVVTASEMHPTRPALVRAHMPVQTAALR